MGDPLAQTGTRPGTQFFAPQARLVTELGQAIEIDGQPISADLISVTATLVNNGIGQVEIVLNNQRHDSENRIVAPIWRYNKLDPVSFGSQSGSTSATAAKAGRRWSSPESPTWRSCSRRPPAPS